MTEKQATGQASDRLLFHSVYSTNASMNSPLSGTCLVSSCLVGLCTRYDGAAKPNNDCIRALHNTAWIPVCPEQLGGLPTPRERAVLTGGNGHDVLAGRAQVVTESGCDVTKEFIRGAEMVLQLAELKGISTVVLKSRSPSCAVHGNMGVTAALLQSHGYILLEY